MLRYLPTVLVLGLLIYGLIDCLRSDADQVRSVPKAAWVLLILLLPVIGVVLWLILGRPRYRSASTAARPTGYRPALRAPDDDEEFLRSLNVRREHQAEAERLEKLRLELEARERKLNDTEQPPAPPDATSSTDS
ncbi:PLD nuclease N-terminal domain-containing protein [Psychromicrobium xiongbiense]|uniref:PLD nuclease N-terminal domain-containing protein n=1 Tax=Psychromicrobium xiongbiense TaxID=3051184 RepID=UPI0025572BBA|nr:PLD nuclease N-terminal domain-containing protein [Psychromicrobium sp. YIM S02556]